MLSVAIIIIKSSNAPEVGQPSKDRKELVELQSRGFLNFFVVVMKDLRQFSVNEDNNS